MKSAKWILKRIGLLLCAVCLIVLTVHFLLGNYYRDKFYPNTWINGVYCTGKTIDEVNAELLSMIKAPIVIVTDDDELNWKFDLSDMGYQADYTDELHCIIEKQKSETWNVFLLSRYDISILPEIAFESEKLQSAFMELSFVKEAVERVPRYEIVYTKEEGYQLYDGVRERLHVKNTLENLTFTISELILQFNGSSIVESEESQIIKISFDDIKSFYEYDLTESEKKISYLWDKIQSFYNFDIVYDMGAEEIVLTDAILSEFLLTDNGLPILDKDDKFMLDEKAVRNFVNSIADQYDTYQKIRKFQSTRGEVVSVKGKTYGTLLDREAEILFLLNGLLDENLHTGQIHKHKPKYHKEAFSRGIDDIGNTYIEVDLTDQKLYYYQKGELKISSDIVSGNVRRGMSTPEGVCYVYAKQTDRILRGRGYASHVNFWMPVNGGIGIHDADWREDFGGEIYKKDGSHGCINMPSEIVPELFEMVEIGTPVIIFK